MDAIKVEWLSEANCIAEGLSSDFVRIWIELGPMSFYIQSQDLRTREFDIIFVSYEKVANSKTNILIESIKELKNRAENNK